MEVLERVGVLVENDAILSLLEDAGANVDRKEKKARIPEYLVRYGLNKAPSSFVLYSRKGKKLRIGKEKTLVIPSANATWILDLETREPRPATKKDVEQTSRLSDALEHTDICAPSVLPQDVEPAIIDISAAEAMMCNTSKPYFMAPCDDIQTSYIIEMAAIISGGVTELENDPLLIGFVSPTSPLRLAVKELEITRKFVEHQLPVFIAPCPNSGATSPVSLAGTLVVMCTEYLSLTLIAELLSPGNPVVVGGALGTMDMKTANISYGSVETALMGAATAEMGHFYNLPSYAAASGTEALVPDAQAGYETAWTTLLPLMAGVDLVVSPGLLGAYTVASYEKLVMDNEILGAIKRVLQGIDISETSLAVDVIGAVGPGGHFLAQKHTREQHTKERWFPKISNRLGLYEWRKERLDLWRRAKKEAMEILRTHKPEPLEKEKEERMKSLIKEAERKMVKS